MVPISHYLFFGAVLFGLGALTVVTRRNALTVFMGGELMLNAANVTFLAFAREGIAAAPPYDLSAHAIAVLVMAVAAAEAAVGLAIVIAVFRTRSTTNVDEFRTMKL